MTEAVDDPTQHDPTGVTPDDAVTAPPEDPITDAITDIEADGGEQVGEIDIAGIEADLDGVQAALTRLADGTYWTDEVTGEPIPADVLVANPLTRRA